MLNISGIHEGFVLDHIKAGMCMQIYNDLKLDKLDCTVAIIKNAKSSKMGKKDIIKVECPIQVTNVIKCKNPRCITSIEQELDQIFVLTDEEKEIYRCKYCEEKYEGVK